MASSHSGLRPGDYRIEKGAPGAAGLARARGQLSRDYRRGGFAHPGRVRRGSSRRWNHRFFNELAVNLVVMRRRYDRLDNKRDNKGVHMVVPAILGGALLVAFVIFFTMIAKAGGHRRRGYSGADGSSFTAFADGSGDNCDSGSSSDGGCGDGGGADGGGGGGD